MSLPLAKRLANSQPWLDRVAERAQPVVRELVGRRPWLRDSLDGTWFGAPLHPALTDVPVGSWTAAFALDAVAGLTGSGAARTGADSALVIGIVGALPAAMTGASDWRDLSGETRRIATLHALLNVGGLALHIASLAERSRGRRGSGRALSTVGLALTAIAAHLGGQLSFGLGVRVNQTLGATETSRFTAVLDERELDRAEMRTVTLDGTPVLVTRNRSGQLCAIDNTCSHFGGPLAEGSREGDVVTCPWHGSRFDVCDGRVIEGPAVFPQPAYEARVRDGKIELRRRPLTDTHPQTTEESSDEGKQEVNNQTPSFQQDIRPLFRQKDIDSMKDAFDLSSYQDVRSNAEKIYDRLADGSMPCDDAWSAQQVQLFHAWMTAGYPQ